MGLGSQTTFARPHPGPLLSRLPRLPLRCLQSLFAPTRLTPAFAWPSAQLTPPPVWTPVTGDSPETLLRVYPLSSSLGCSPEDAAPPCLLNKHMPRPQSVLLDCAPGLLGRWEEDRRRLGSHQHGSQSPSGPQQETAAPGPVASFGWTLPSPPPQASSRPHMTLTSRSDWPSRNTEGVTPHFHVWPPAIGTTAEAQPGPGSWRGAARAEVLSHSTSSGPLWVLEDGS